MTPSVVIIVFYCVAVFHELLPAFALHQFATSTAPDSPEHNDFAPSRCTEELSELENNIKKAEQIR